MCVLAFIGVTFEKIKTFKFFLKVLKRRALVANKEIHEYAKHIGEREIQMGDGFVTAYYCTMRLRPGRQPPQRKNIY